MSVAASSGEYIKKRLDCQEAKFEYGEDEGLKLWLGMLAACYSFSQEKRDMFNSTIQLFPCFHWQWVFPTLGSTAVECLMEYKADSGHCGSSVPTGLFNRLLTSS